jgi:LysR family cyn operon transcriptional activator
MELTALRQFIAIADAGHMTRAARTLGVTQPALSAMVRKLEEQTGTELLNRTGRGVELTEAGRVFAQHARDAVRAADAGVRAVRQLAGLESGSIRVGGGATAITYLLPPIVSQFRKAHPGLKFYVREGGSSAIAQSVLSGELDLGIVTMPLARELTPTGKGGLSTRSLVDDELRLIVPPKHALAGERAFRWKDLAGERVVAFEAGSAVREVIDRAAAGAGVSLDVVMELRSIESIKQMVSVGIGVGFVSRFALRDGQGLVCKDGTLARGLALVRAKDRSPSNATSAFEAAVMGSVGRSGTR